MLGAQLWCMGLLLEAASQGPGLYSLPPIPTLRTKSATQMRSPEHKATAVLGQGWPGLAHPTSTPIRPLTWVLLHLTFPLMWRLRNVGKVPVLQIPGACFNDYFFNKEVYIFEEKFGNGFFRAHPNKEETFDEDFSKDRCYQ